jgi:ribosomal-protein-alanine N-acetyltransferase
VAPIGLCGFHVFEGLGDEPQLSSAFLRSHTIEGHATEAARARIRFCRNEARMDEIVSSVDEPNAGSMPVLEKVGFRRHGSVPGALGLIVRYRLAADA